MRCSRPLLCTLALAVSPAAAFAAEAPPTAVDSSAASSPRIAVVDFAGADKDFGAGLAEALQKALGHYEGVQRVECDAVRETLAKLKLSSNGPLDAHQVRRVSQLVRAGRLVVGSGQVSDDQVTLAASLFDAVSGQPVAAGVETVSGSRPFLFCLTKRLAHRVCQRLIDPSSPSPPDSFSGLVIDARHLRVQRAMGPRILDEEGRVIYPVSPKHVPPMLTLQDHGMAAYVTGGIVTPRSGSHPLVVRATDVAGPTGDDVVVSKEVEEQILQANTYGGFLESWSVSILMTPSGSAPLKQAVFRFKNGDILTGAVLETKDGQYVILTDLGQISFSEDKVERIDPKE